jgi:hypothetical protein
VKHWTFTVRDNFNGSPVRVHGVGEDADSALKDALSYPLYVSFRDATFPEWQHRATPDELAYIARDDQRNGWFAEWRFEHDGRPERVRVWVYGAMSEALRVLE